MCQTTLSVWFVCRLCRGSFGQVDAFIEHKKEKHFTQFQNTTSIVFEERELDQLFPVVTNGDLQIQNQNNAPPIKIEVTDEEPIFPFSSEITDELNLGVVEPKSELMTYKSEINTDTENSFLGLKQPRLNPYVIIKRLTSEEILSACIPFRHLKYEQNNLANGSEAPTSLDTDSNIIENNEIEKPAEIQLTAAVIQFAQEHGFHECKLCSKQLESEAQLKIHVAICALYHEDRNRFCVTCNQKLCNTRNLKGHRLRFHGTEEEKLSLYKFKCHICPKQYQVAIHLRLHLKSHEQKKHQIGNSKPKPFKCSHPSCGKGFSSNSKLQRHIAIHFGIKPFSCSFPNCNRTFSQRANMERHCGTHTGERPYKCTVDNCNKTFTTSQRRSIHHLRVHCNL